MRNHRMAVGNSLKGKIKEFGFFLFQITQVSKIIEEKHVMKDYPLGQELDKLNYYFSAFLNAIQSIKDACQTSMGIKLTWNELSSTYGSFIFYCRNAITHDGSHMINAGQGVKNYIVGPLRRIDNRGDSIEFDPPKDDILSLCCYISKEVLGSLKNTVLLNGQKIPVANENDFKNSFELSLESDFIPEYVKEMIKGNKDDISSSFKSPDIDLVKQICGCIESIEGDLVTYNVNT